jgi:eukaryotic-like serine/threonine-protein kinase
MQQIIDGRYTIIERIGRGAMGVVFKAHDSVLDRHVAIKQMAGELDDDPHLRLRFSQEARAAARLTHRNIITIHELHESEGQIYIVMELLDGVDLATLVKRQVPLPLEAKLNLMAQVCDGLDFAHASGIVHRDVKPANLHVSPSGLVTILDFGIARLAELRMTSIGGLVGTPDYMSPEQVMAGPLDARSDLYAVGTVAYELLSGKKPFEAESVAALLMKIVHEPHIPLRVNAPHLPAAVVDLVERLLSKNPAARPATARDVRQALLAIASDRPVADTATLALISGAVAEETLRRKTTPRSAATPVPPSAATSSAIARGRALANSGDLSGAMRIFRAVLEISPGNLEAHQALEDLEGVVARLASGRAAGSSAPQSSPSSAVPPTLVATAPRGWPRGALAASVVVIALAGAAALYLLSSSPVDSTAEEGSLPAASVSDSPRPSSPEPAQETSSPQIMPAPIEQAAATPEPVADPPSPAPPPASTRAPAVRQAANTTPQAQLPPPRMTPAASSSAASTPPLAATARTEPAASPPPAPIDPEILLWASVEKSSRVSDYEVYLKQYPQGIFTALARRRLAELTPAPPPAAAAAAPAPAAKPTSMAGLSGEPVLEDGKRVLRVTTGGVSKEGVTYTTDVSVENIGGQTALLFPATYYTRQKMLYGQVGWDSSGDLVVTETTIGYRSREGKVAFTAPRTEVLLKSEGGRAGDTLSIYVNGDRYRFGAGTALSGFVQLLRRSVDDFPTVLAFVQQQLSTIR